MNLLRKYFKEILHLKFYLLAITSLMILGYLLLFILDEELVCNLGEEDAIIEWSSAIFLLVASVVLLATFIKTRNLFFILLSFIFFIGFGEEISWGQRLFNYETPTKIKKLNVQKEF